MTTETRTVIEFSDISRVEFECPFCRTRLVKELSEQNVVPTRCKGGMCSHVFFAEGSKEHAEMQSALDVIGAYAKSGQKSFVLRLEVKPSNSQR